LTRYLQAHCNTCGENFKFDIEDKTPDQVREIMEGQRMFTCPGRHVELSGPLEHVTVDWVNVIVGDPPMTNEEFGASLIKEVGKEHLYYLGGDEVGQKLGLQCLQSVPGLRHIGFGEFENDKFAFIRRDSPSGYRFYVASPR